MTALDLEEIAPDVSIAELEQRWGVSRNTLKARAKALGIELIRQGPTLTTWPGDRVAEGDRLDAHLKAGGAMAAFPGVAATAAGEEGEPSVTPQGVSASGRLAVSGGKVDQITALAAAIAAAMSQPAPLPPHPLDRGRSMGEAADERIPLTSAELAALAELPVEEVAAMKSGTSLYGFRLQRVGTAPRKGAPDRRAWLLEREAPAPDAAETAAVSGGSVPAVTAPREGRRAPGFMACIQAEGTVLSRLELPRW